MKIKREKLLGLWALVEKLKGEKTSVRFHFALQKIKRLIAPEVEAIQAVATSSEEYMKFDQQRIALCNEYCAKDPSGKPLVANQSFVIPEENKDSFNAALEALKDQHAPALKEAEERQKELVELFDEEIELDLPKIPLSVMPEQLSGDDTELLFDFIEE